MDASIFDWPTVRDVARRLNVSQQYISRMIAQRSIHAVRTPLGYFVDPISVTAFEAARATRRRIAC